MPNYTVYHCHSDNSLLDSTTKFDEYINLALQNGMTALGSTEHGLPRGNTGKRLACKKAGIKFLYGVEVYLTRTLAEKVRDNYHTVLIAKDAEGVKEINLLIKQSTDDAHTYYNNRITFEEFLRVSRHVIKISACIASPLSKLEPSDPWYDRLARAYDFYEVQHHNCEEQKKYNQYLYLLSKRYGKPLIAGTDTHSSTPYKEECRKLLMKSKGKFFPDEDKFDLVFKTYDELIEAYRVQNALPESVYLEAIENTNVMAAMVEDYELDTATKYPISYGSPEEDARRYKERVAQMFEQKLASGVIPKEQEAGFRQALKEELAVFEKVGMMGFMLSMSELIEWCHQNGICTGTARGSVGGSRAAYITDIIDLNPEQWHTIFSRFCNENRVEIGDIDVDVIESDRPRIFEHIAERFGERKTARVAAYGTIGEKGCIDDICRGLKYRWIEQHVPGVKPESVKDAAIPSCPYRLTDADAIKTAYEADPEAAKAKYPDVFYYLEGMLNTRVSQSVHAAGMVISPITLDDNVGTFHKDGTHCLLLDMDECHDIGLAKYDLLALRNVEIIRDSCYSAGTTYPKTCDVDFDDPAVWRDMLRSPIGIFQMESQFAFDSLKRFQPRSIFDMSLVTASIRPSGASYRDSLLARIPHKNPSPVIDELLKNGLGYLVYQEDIIAFLQQVCGFDGSTADSVRRLISKKDFVKLEAYMPQILDGYCAKSDKPRTEAEKEARQFLQVIIDASAYAFGYNHSIAYCILGYFCARERYYHPGEFITSFLNHAANDADIAGGKALADLYGFRVTDIKFGKSRAGYSLDRESKQIVKGLDSIGYLSAEAGETLYEAAKHVPDGASFMDVMKAIRQYAPNVNRKQIEILISLDFFSDYGNARELLAIREYFNVLGEGKLTRISKEAAEKNRLNGIIDGHATDIGKSGVLKNWNITDMPGLLEACEQHVRSQHLADMTVKEKLQAQNEYVGYLSPLGDAYRGQMYVTSDVRELRSKKTGRRWAYSFSTFSLRNGQAREWTVRCRDYQEPVTKGDIIVAVGGSNAFEVEVYKGRQYYYLIGYRLCA